MALAECFSEARHRCQTLLTDIVSVMATPTQLLRQIRIPDDLVSLVAERRVIPFVGAGFSSGLGLPDWETLLMKLAAEVDPGLPFEDIRTMANGDYLQIAEFLYIKSDKRIGPLRHVIESLLGTAEDPVLSGAHVELVNLGAPQVYTTNYDDLLERTYRGLGIPVSLVALPKDVANSDNDKPQVVKYHGDLRHENTLVLTESAYYRRLDLESPMDLKFRSDILGRSVLFMGYSFRDVNIRLIWFKLMQMMQDIPPDDRRASYILKVGPNPVQDALFKDVGLHPITLDPRGELDAPDRQKLLAEFLSMLASRAAGANHSIPGTTDPMFVSKSLLESLPHEREAEESPFSERYGTSSASAGIVRRFWSRRVPFQLVVEAETVFKAILLFTKPEQATMSGMIQKINMFGPSEELTEWFTGVLKGGSRGNHALRAQLMGSPALPWHTVMATPVSLTAAKKLVAQLKREVDWHLSDHADGDIVYLSYVVKALRAGLTEFDENVDRVAGEQLERAEAIYPSIADIQVAGGAKPVLDAALNQVEARQASLGNLDESPDIEELDLTNYFLDWNEDDLFAPVEEEPG